MSRLRRPPRTRHRATASVPSPLTLLLFQLCWVLLGRLGPGLQNNLAADPVCGSTAFGDRLRPFLGRLFPFRMRTHRAVTAGVDAGLVNVVLLTGGVDGRQP